MVYSNGNFVYAIGGIPVGSGSVTPPTPSTSEKSLFIASDDANCIMSASAYINGTGSPVAVWSATNGSASASVTLGSGDYVVVAAEASRPTGYSSTIYSTGYTTGSPRYTTAQTVVVSGTATYAGPDSAIMSARYYGAMMIVTGEGSFWVGLHNYKLDWPGWYESPMVIPNSVSSSPVAHLAYTNEYWHSSHSDRSAWSAYQYVPTVSAFSILKFTASGKFSMTTAAAAGSSVISAFQENTDRTVPPLAMRSATYTGNLSNYSFAYTGNVNTNTAGTAHSYYKRPSMQINNYRASAYISQSYWKYSGRLK
jgi:ribosomal protein L35